MTDSRAITRRICIMYPIPLDVSGNIILALGTMYPDAVIRTDDPRSDRSLVIDLGTRKARSSKRRIVAEMETEESEAEITGLGDGVMQFTTPKEATETLAIAANIMLTSHEATNYVEQLVHMNDGRSFVFHAAWSKGQTPHELRMKAEARIVELEARIAELEARS